MFNEYQLKNGFKIIVKEDHRSPIAIFQICYKVGSGYEYTGITGISHALEHMMFSGTGLFNKNKVLKTFTDTGGQFNALTGRDYTSYYEILHSDKIESSFHFEADRMQNLLLRPIDFAKEKKIIIEERRLTVEDNPKHLLLEQLYAVAFSTSQYRHPIIGWRNDLENMSLNDLTNWYHTWYNPNNAIAIIVGDVNPRQMYKLARKYFGKIKPLSLPPGKSSIDNLIPGSRSINIKIPAKFPYLTLGYKTPVITTATDTNEPYALWVLCEILAGSISSRLHQRLVLKDQITLDVKYSYSPFNRLNNMATISATPISAEKIEAVKDTIIHEIYKIQKKLPSVREINRIKTQVIADKIYDEDSIINQAMNIMLFEAIGLSWQDIERSYENITAITPQQVQNVAKKYFVSDRFILATLTPLPLVASKVAKLSTIKGALQS